jgi:hypothetical protein
MSPRCAAGGVGVGVVQAAGRRRLGLPLQLWTRPTRLRRPGPDALRTLLSAPGATTTTTSGAATTTGATERRGARRAGRAARREAARSRGRPRPCARAPASGCPSRCLHTPSVPRTQVTAVTCMPRAATRGCCEVGAPGAAGSRHRGCGRGKVDEPHLLPAASTPAPPRPRLTDQGFWRSAGPVQLARALAGRRTPRSPRSISAARPPRPCAPGSARV